jgi:ribosomal protein S18 acetylase RimI-like enzyme
MARYAMDIDRLTTAWRRILTEPSPGVQRLVLCVDGRAVGWSGFGTPRDEADDGTGELQALNLRPGCWSQGLGSDLFRESVAALTEMGYKRAYLWVAHGNERAARFYGRHGWTAD